jgi:hypothetical protein
MWQFPWKYKESIAVVGGMAAMGFMLQLTVGNFNFYLLQWPVNLIVGGLLVGLILLFSLARRSPLYQWLSGVPLAVTLLSGLLILGLIMGLTPQWAAAYHPHNGSDLFTLLGFRQITSSWPFVLLYWLLLLSLGALIVRRLIAFRLKDYASYFNHIGLWVLLFSAGLGAADTKRYVMHVREGEVEWRVYSEDQHGNQEMLELPIAIRLNDFDMEEYPPKLTLIDRETGEPQPADKPDYFQLDEKRPHGSLNGWEVELDEYIHQAVRNSDSTYHAVPMPGATPAAKIRVRHPQTGDTLSGWVCGGNAAQLYMILPVDPRDAIVMTRPEPKRFTSDITVFLPEGEEQSALLEVNHPLRIGSWMIYQYGYDNEAGRMSTYSSMELVYDPWLYPAYAGIGLLAVGAISLLWTGNRKKKENSI